MGAHFLERLVSRCLLFSSAVAVASLADVPSVPTASNKKDTQEKKQKLEPDDDHLDSNALRDLSEASGGYFFDGGERDFGESLDFALDSIFRNLYRIAWIRGNLQSDGRFTTEVPIDSAISVAQFVLNVSKCQEFKISVHRPDGSIVQQDDQGTEIKSIPGFTRIRILQPPIGQWKVAIEGEGRFLFTADGETSIHVFGVQIYRMTGEPGRCGPAVEEVAPELLIRQNVFVEATLIGKIKEPSIQFLTTGGRLLEKLETKVGVLDDEIIVSEYTPTRAIESFIVRVSGKDDAGNSMQRVLMREFSVQPFVIRPYFSGPPGESPPGRFRFQALNAGPPDQFAIEAETLAKFPTKVSPAQLALSTDGSAFIDVEVDIDESEVRRGAELTVSMKSSTTRVRATGSTRLERD